MRTTAHHGYAGAAGAAPGRWTCCCCGSWNRTIPRLNAREQSLFGSLLDEADPDLYAWITGQAQPANPDYLPLIGKISDARF